MRNVSHIDIQDIPEKALGEDKQVQKSQGKSDPGMLKNMKKTNEARLWVGERGSQKEDQVRLCTWLLLQ